MSDFLSTLIVIALSLVVVFVIVVLVLLVLMIRKFRQVHRPGAPTSTRVSFWVSTVYTVFPLDLLPDPIYVDDIVVLITALIHVSVTLREHSDRARIAGRI